MDEEIINLYKNNELTKDILNEWGVTREKDIEIIFKNNYKYGNMLEELLNWYKNN